jgi:Actin and related proteins
MLIHTFQCPIDMRKPLAENILVIGGTAMAPGFKARLLDELKHLVQQPKYESRLAVKIFKFHKPPAKENYVAWLGGKDSKHNFTCETLTCFFIC